MTGADSPELIPLLGEIRDQLKRIGDLLTEITQGKALVNVEIGEPTVKIREPAKKWWTD